jgi:hypothetical protein
MTSNDQRRHSGVGQTILQPTTVHHNVQYILVGALAVLFALSALARRFPRIDWLQYFRFERPYDPRRDRHLDTAWMDPAEALRRRKAPREAFAEVRERVRDFVGELPQLPEARKAMLRRSSNVRAGVQLILLGIALPFGYYIFSMMMFFSSVGTTEIVFLFAASAVCIALGITAIWRSGKP